MSSVVLDASAVLALLHKERGADVVERHLAGAALLTVNYSEVLKKAIDKGGDMHEAESFIRGLQMEIIPFDEELAIETAMLWEPGKMVGLSMADRSCLALGRVMSRPVLTADVRWAKIDLGIKVKLIR